MRLKIFLFHVFFPSSVLIFDLECSHLRIKMLRTLPLGSESDFDNLPDGMELDWVRTPTHLVVTDDMKIDPHSDMTTVQSLSVKQEHQQDKQLVQRVEISPDHVKREPCSDEENDCSSQ